MFKVLLLVFLVNQVYCVQNCLRWLKVKPYDDCQEIAYQNDITVNDLTRMNSGLNCNNLQPKHQVCTAVSRYSDSKTKHIDCIEKRSVEGEASCLELARQASITIDEFKILNPDLDCDQKSVITGVDVCFKGPSSINCADVQLNTFTNPCYNFIKNYRLSKRELLRLNPPFNCKTMQKNEQVCVGRGPFKYSECIETLKIKSDVDTCSKLSKKTKISEGHIMMMNPAIDCFSKLDVSSLGMNYFSLVHWKGTYFIHGWPKPFEWDRLYMNPHARKPRDSSELVTIDHFTVLKVYCKIFSGSWFQRISRFSSMLICANKTENLSIVKLKRLVAINPPICVRSLGMDTQKAQRLFISSLAIADETLSETFEDFLNNPSGVMSEKMRKQVYASLRKQNVNSHLKDLYRRSVDIRKIIDLQFPLSREEYCQRSKNQYTSENIQNCYCDNTELIVYCQALEHQQLNHKIMRKISNRSLNETVERPKSFFSLERKKAENCAIRNRCFGSCSNSAPPLEFNFVGTPCLEEPPNSQFVKPCTITRSECLDERGVCEEVIGNMFDTIVDVNLKVCLKGKELIEALGRVELQACWDMEGTFTPFTGILLVAELIDGAAGTLFIKFEQKLTEVQDAAICNIPVHAKENYCQWRKHKLALKGRVEVVYTGWSRYMHEVIFNENIWKTS